MLRQRIGQANQEHPKCDSGTDRRPEEHRVVVPGEWHHGQVDGTRCG